MPDPSEHYQPPHLPIGEYIPSDLRQTASDAGPPVSPPEPVPGHVFIVDDPGLVGEPAGIRDDVEHVRSAGVFALLRDIADAEPITELVGHDETYGAACTMCKAEVLNAREILTAEYLSRSKPRQATCPEPELLAWAQSVTDKSAVPPVQHLISCPWARAVHIVGTAPTEAPAVGLPASAYHDVERSTDGGRTWSLFEWLAPKASLRLTVGDGKVHDDGRGTLYRKAATGG